MPGLGLTPEAVPTSAVRWLPCYRAVSAHVSPDRLFERVVADADELAAILLVEARTDDAARHKAERLEAIPREDWVFGSGAGLVMGAFIHYRDEPARFRTPEFGVYYAAGDRETAIAETRHHRARFLLRTAQPPIEVEMQLLVARLDARLHDVRSLRDTWPALYHPTDYTASMALGRSLREARSWGVVYHSVRHRSGECAAVLRPPALTGCAQGERLTYVWDGERIADVRTAAAS